jgi:hypothetical protein
VQFELASLHTVVGPSDAVHTISGAPPFAWFIVVP